MAIIRPSVVVIVTIDINLAHYFFTTEHIYENIIFILQNK